MTTTPFPLPPGLPPTDTLYYPALSTSSTTTERETYILFLPGNPGLIEYYRRFLGTLAALLARKVHVLGVSHAGFYSQQTAAREVVEGGGEGEGEGEGAGKGYWTLAEQVVQKVGIVEWIVGGGAAGVGDGKGGLENEGKLAEGEKERRMRPRVIIMGHSVGAYIAMETLRVLGEKREKRRAEGGGEDGAEGEAEDEPEVFGGVMLFPTVVDIAKSPSGKILSALLTLTGAYLPLLISHLSHPLSLLPTRLVYAMIRLLTFHPPSATATTLSLLTTPGAVFQALSMARDEMAEITHDRWDYGIWGSEKAGVSRLWFYFGKNDHWVAEETREAIMKTRGRGMGEEWKPRMVLDEGGVPHGFCIEHGEVMAEKVAGWVKGMLEE
ncbi:uncharacterized protein H6S33_012607 [Morchella sextelata]|uniref:uncharacterized protein n=1 Tax=Morchella sextelata TaxID=1174677 RepID=UPI001D051F25|nr:uncharacterized protein H6S33_012607 [Morchella sextelata]KAH0610061.1 hypothetical protein H6S33_012607 [Morchella sextelata]